LLSYRKAIITHERTNERPYFNDNHGRKIAKSTISRRYNNFHNVKNNFNVKVLDRYDTTERSWMSRGCMCLVIVVCMRDGEVEIIFRLQSNLSYVTFQGNIKI